MRRPSRKLPAATAEPKRPAVAADEPRQGVAGILDLDRSEGQRAGIAPPGVEAAVDEEQTRPGAGQPGQGLGKRS